MTSHNSSNELKHLMSKKDELESEIKELMSVLESQKGVGLHEKLVDEEGFPRSDIDIYSIRHARHNVIRLQNDHKAIMKEIEVGLHNLHAETRLQKSMNDAMEIDKSDSSDNSKVDFTKAFVRVDRVDDNSPADEAGLEVNDMITQFGSITKNNFQNLQTIGTVVQHSVQTNISVTVIRKGVEIHLALMPKKWSGRGLLGCNILPVN